MKLGVGSILLKYLLVVEKKDIGKEIKVLNIVQVKESENKMETFIDKGDGRRKRGFNKKEYIYI